MKPAEIFEKIGISIEQIRAVAGLVSRPREPVVSATPESERLVCLICGKPIGKFSCKPFRKINP